MPRAKLRQSQKTLLAKLEEERDSLKTENNELRKAAQQLMEGLTEYAKEENWKKPDPPDSGIWEWKGDGDGPSVARKWLGLDQEGN